MWNNVKISAQCAITTRMWLWCQECFSKDRFVHVSLQPLAEYQFFINEDNLQRNVLQFLFLLRFLYLYRGGAWIFIPWNQKWIPLGQRWYVWYVEGPALDSFRLTSSYFPKTGTVGWFSCACSWDGRDSPRVLPTDCNWTVSDMLHRTELLLSTLLPVIISCLEKPHIGACWSILSLVFCCVW